jgi:hypothetical protein
VQVWHLNDSDERGVGNVAGAAFRRWGDVTGSGPVEPLRARVAPLPDPKTIKTPTDRALAQTLRRAHPLYAPTVLLMLQVRLPGLDAPALFPSRSHRHPHLPLRAHALPSVTACEIAAARRPPCMQPRAHAS